MATQVEALAGTVEALRASGRVQDEDEASVALAEGLARAIDGDPSNAALWREYRAALSALREVGVDGGDDDTKDFIVSIQTPGAAKVRNSKKS